MVVLAPSGVVFAISVAYLLMEISVAFDGLFPDIDFAKGVLSPICSIMSETLSPFLFVMPHVFLGDELSCILLTNLFLCPASPSRSYMFD